MKVIKRDGRIVDYDPSKIEVAIEKANNEVQKKDKATKDDIKIIIQYIEDLNKKRILVEDIQDIIEFKLMELGKYDLAKKYIVYRYTRALIRKSNTTDASILGLIRNGNIKSGNTISAWKQRNLIVGEVSKDLTKRVLLPEKIVNAWKEGELYFHDAEFFIQPIINTSIVNLADMLDNGTVINGKKIETPKSFQVACIILTQIVEIVSNNQYGEQTIDICCLGKYLRKSIERIKNDSITFFGNDAPKNIIDKYVNLNLKRVLEAGIQTILYQINTQINSEPKVKMVLNIQENDEYIDENAQIIEEFIRQVMLGIKNENDETIYLKNPKLIYVLNNNNCTCDSKYYEITRLVEQCNQKTGMPIISKEFQMEEKFNQGIVCINLAQIGILCDGDEKKFWDLLQERVELCKEALMYRYYSLIGTDAEISPIHWKYGGISRLEEGEKIDQLLNKENSSLYLGFYGLNEVIDGLKKEELSEDEKEKIKAKILDYIKTQIMKWRKESNLGFKLYEFKEEKVGKYFLNIDKERFGTIKGITDKEIYY